MKYEWLLFDLDNTLLDFDITERHALTQSLENIGISLQSHHLDTYEVINRTCWDAFEAGTLPQSEINKTRFEEFLKALKVPISNAVEFGDYYLDQLAGAAFFIEGAKELLEECSEIYQLGIVTNGLKRVQRPRLINNNMTQYFEVIIVSDEIGVSKPNASFFDYAFEQMKYPSKDKVLIIGDSLGSDIQGGIDFGIDTCWYNPKGKGNPSKIKSTYEISTLKELSTLKII